MSKTAHTHGADGLGRRAFLGASAAGAALIASPWTARRARANQSAPGRARNLIFAVADGMSTGTFSLADMMTRRKHGRPSRWVGLQSLDSARRAMLNTSAADSIVTDSAAASTAWGIGTPVNNGSIGKTPEGRLMSPILLRAKDEGKATGLITTTRLTHATPAGFVACVPGDRDDEGPIAEQILERGVDVMLGGGSHYFTRELLAARSDLQVVRNRDELRAAAPSTPRRLLGLFAEQHMAYEIERPVGEPSLAEMASAGLARLASRQGGFVLQIEGGRVDHAAHMNDAGAIVRDQLAFDEALGVAVDFVLERDDTLLIATTDHANGNPGLSEYGAKGNDGFERLSACAHSFEWIAARLGASRGEVSADRLREVVHEATRVMLTDEEAALVLRARSGEPVDPYATASAGSGPLGSVLANHFGVAFQSPNHTSDYVELTAFGPGSAALPAYLAHADVHRFIVHALDLPPARAM